MQQLYEQYRPGTWADVIGQDKAIQKIHALARRDLARAFAKRAREIAVKEGLDGQPIARYVKLANDCKANFRAMLMAVESGEMLG